MISKLSAFAEIFKKQAEFNIMPFGVSTVSVDEARPIALKIKAAWESVPEYHVDNYQSDNFEFVINTIADGAVPPSESKKRAAREWQLLKSLDVLYPFNSNSSGNEAWNEYGDFMRMLYVQNMA